MNSRRFIRSPGKSKLAAFDAAGDISSTPRSCGVGAFRRRCQCLSLLRSHAAGK